MYWNYRVIKRNSKFKNNTENAYYIHEVFYSADGKKYFTENEISPKGETLVELRKDLFLMLCATYKNSLDYNKLVNDLKRDYNNAKRTGGRKCR